MLFCQFLSASGATPDGSAVQKPRRAQIKAQDSVVYLALICEGGHTGSPRHDSSGGLIVCEKAYDVHMCASLYICVYVRMRMRTKRMTCAV